jgi:hypothetical protein
MTTVLDKELAGLGADASMTLAAAHADRVNEGWSDDALGLFRLYAIQKPDGFMTEEVRAWAEKLGFTPPPDNRAWGLVARRAHKDGYVVACGYQKQSSASCHGSPKTLWKRSSK